MDLMALWDISYGLYVIGAMKEGKKVGCVVNTVSQVTSENPIICVSMNKNNVTHDAIRELGRFSVSILSDDTNPRVIGIFGFRSSEQTDKYQPFAHEMVDGVPVVTEGITGYLVCQVLSFIDAESHSLIMARVVEAKKVSGLHPMTYEYYHKVIKGKAPKTAPTYQADKKPEKQRETYVCDVCGYVYEGDFSQAPADYVCPVCKVDKSHFQKRQ